MEGSGSTFQPSDWSPDGTLVALTAFRPGSGADILVYSFETGEVRTHLETEYDEQLAAFSPDGRWLAYESDESGVNEIYVQAFPGPGGKWQVSTGEAEMPTWSADGRELFYVSDDGHLMAVPVETEGAFRHDTPVALFEAPFFTQLQRHYDPLPDGSGFIALTSNTPEDGTSDVILIEGFADEVRRRLDAR